MPLALVLNELLTNAMKYGLREDGENVIQVELRRDEEGFVLSVEDEGPGFELEAVRSRSSGLLLVQRLARQLRGRLEVVSKPRSRCIVRFA